MKKVSSLEHFNKTNMYKSDFQVSALDNHANLRQSVISVGSTNNRQMDVEKNKLTYKYERVGNIFRLVQVKNENESIKSDEFNPEKLKYASASELEKINLALESISSRLTTIQLQQTKMFSLDRKINNLYEQNNNIAEKMLQLQERNVLFEEAIEDVRQRVEELEQQSGSSEKEMNNILELIQQIKQEAIKNIPGQYSSVEMKLNQWRKEIQEQISRIDNKLKQRSQSAQNGSRKLLDFLRNDSYKVKGGSFTDSGTPRQSRKIKYRETLQTEDNNIYLIDEIKYFVDIHGQLLDDSGFILLDSNNQSFKISQNHIEKLKQYGLLGTL